MKLNDQQLAELKALADAATPGPWWSGECVPADGHALAWLGNMFVDCNGGQKNYAEPSHDAEFIAASREAIPALIADLEEAQRTVVALAPDALREADERKSIAAGLEAVWRGRMQDAEAAHQAELADVRKQLAEAQSSEAHWRANHDNVVRKLRFFTQRDDLPVDRLQAYEYVLELEKQLAEAQARNAQVLSVAEKMRCAGGAQEFQHWFDELKLFLLRKPDISAIEAAVEAAVPHDLPSEQSFLDSGGYLLLEKQND